MRSLFVMIFFLGICFTAFSQKEFKFNDTVTLSGKLLYGYYKTVAGEKKGFYLLSLDKSIHVLADPNDPSTSDALNQKEIHIVFAESEKKYVNKKVKVQGVLGYGNTQYHRRTVMLFDAQKIN